MLMVDFQEIKDKFLPIFYAAKVQENLYFKGSLLISLIFYPNSLEVRIIYLLRQCLSQSLPDFGYQLVNVAGSYGKQHFRTILL